MSKGRKLSKRAKTTKRLLKLVQTEVESRINRPKLSVVVPVVSDGGAGESPLYQTLGGVPVLARTLLALDQISAVREIVVVVREAELLYVADLCRNFGIGAVKQVVVAEAPGLGAVETGVYACDRGAGFIAVHDPCRPFVTAEVLEAAVAVAAQSGAAVSAVPVRDTIKIVSGTEIRETPDRDSLYVLQSPLVVESSLLKAALVRAGEQGLEAAELSGALELLGLPLRMAEGSEENIRIGNGMELPAAEAIWARRTYG